jgi:hypothetical protein
MHAAVRYKAFEAPADIPLAWVGAARKQLSAAALRQRGTINWDVPRAELNDIMRSYCTSLRSPPLYLAGSALQLLLQGTTQTNGSCKFGAFMVPCDYKQHGVLLARSPAPGCDFEIRRQKLGPNKALASDEYVVSASATLSMSGWGTREAFSVTTPADLEPHLVDGYLKLTASITIASA